MEKHRGYCLDCLTEFETDDASKPCPNCGSGDWVLQPQLGLGVESAGMAKKARKAPRKKKT